MGLQAESCRTCSLSAWRQLGHLAGRVTQARLPLRVAPAGAEGQPGEAGQAVTVHWKNTCEA